MARPSLERRLPLMMTAILAIILIAALAATFGTLARAARDTARAGLRRAIHQLAALADSSISTARTRYVRAARDTAVHRALQTGKSDSTVAAALTRLRLPNDSGLPIELWTADRRRVAFIGEDRSVAPPPKRDDRGVRAASLHFTGIDSVRGVDTAQVGKLFTVGNRTYAWTVMPVLEHERVAGYIAREARVVGNPQIQQSIRALAGEDVTTYYRNADGSVWVNVGGGQLAPATLDSTHGEIVGHRGSAVSVNEEERIAGSPLLVGMELPEPAVLAGPRSLLRSLLLLSFALLVTGSVLSWLAARRVTRPLRDLTSGAVAIARGDYDARVSATNYDEVAQLSQAFNHMTGEIAASHAELEKRTAEAQEANRAKSEFLATMSHELRTPLNAIGGYVELLEMELRGPITDAQRRDLSRIRVAQAHLLSLIGGMLDLARIESGKVAYHLEAVLVEPFLASIDELIAPQASAKSLDVHHRTADASLAVRADPEKLRQILLNLLSNAIRFTPTGGAVTLDAAAADASHVEIHVADTGPGIPAEKRETIFEAFVQLDRSLTRSPEGVGLGLAISRDLARGMDGDLRVSDRPGGGACFTLTLPRARATGAAVFTTGEIAARSSSRA